MPGAEVVQEPIEQPYGVRDCAFRDPAGNMVRIQELSANPDSVDYAAALRELFALDPQAIAAVMSPVWA